MGARWLEPPLALRLERHMNVVGPFILYIKHQQFIVVEDIECLIM